MSFHTLLSEKDKSLQKCQDIIQSEREQFHLERNKLIKEIDALNETILSLNDSLQSKELEKHQLKVKYDRELERIVKNNNKTNQKKESIDNEDNANAKDEITDETIEEMYQQEQSQDHELKLFNNGNGQMNGKEGNGGDDNELLMATSVREKHELEIIKTIPVGKEIKVLQMELTRAKDQLRYYEEKANNEDSEKTVLRNRSERIHDFYDIIINCD